MKTPFHPRAAAAILLGLALAASGCPTATDTCESSALCEAGSFCFDGRCVASLPAGSCTPPTSGAITTGTVTKTDPGSCFPWSPATWPAKVAPFDTGWQASLGEHAVGETVQFTVPPGTASITIHSQGVTAAATFDYFGQPVPNSVVPTALRAPNGETVYQNAITEMPPKQPLYSPAYYGGLTPWTGSFTYPATSRLLDLTLSGGELPAGDWSFRVHDWNVECAGIYGCTPGTTGQYDITVVTRPGPFVSTGTLDVAIYLASGSINAATAAASPAYQRMVDGIGMLLGRAGICLGTVTFFDLPAWAETAYSTVLIDDAPPCGDLAGLFSLASPTVDGVHLFLVDVLDTNYGGGGGSQIVGIDGSIPGPSGLPGAVTSGAAMSLANIDTVGCSPGVFDVDACGADTSAYIAAHEIGHWLGLYHVTEATGDQFDGLADTRTCSCDACGNGCGDPYGMSPADCSESSGDCGGGDNLMFWVLYPPWSLGKVTADQGLVMRLNPAVK